ncbi:1-phosphatidylinositol 4,5-bisphosphate phosphodiesterase delta-4-like isoform X2 [Acanthaster planci]|uniref:Phosphoinositide phospholipase C n=1 Tax=Acanthaster planci TaxID=133434 RepID=A0A8B8A222_ACAPL|nr:1-phosphatidylinositol 4,5-bisphosphate phosphodiesterase delta-4-like isoform X2 [Acanthaster planci]
MSFLAKKFRKGSKKVEEGADAAQVNPVLQHMQNGTKFIKIRENGSKTYSRSFALSEDGLTLEYHPSKKTSSRSKIPVQDIHEVRSGHETDTFKNNKVKTKYSSDLCLALIVGAENHTINLVAPTKEDARMWAQGLRWAQKKAQNLNIKDKQAAWIRETFEKADRNQDGSVDFEECMKLLKKMNVKMDKNHAKKLFETADVHTHQDAKGKTVTKALDAEEFISFYQMVTRRPELVKVFQEYSGEDDYWTLQEFVEFMHEEMKRLQVKPQWCKEIIQKYEPSEECKKRDILSFDGFQLFMKGPNGLLFNPFHSTIYQDMKQPLCHYFINSSHNTYLMKDQLRGPSSTEAYVRALQRGCRCVELDCWDGSDKEPVVYHGHTLTSKIKFKDAIEAIEKYAFATSEYPLILSLENHCSIEQQKVMAHHLKTTFGNKIYMTDITPDQKVLPSPEDLKGRVLVKNKKLPPPVESSQEDDGDVSDEDEAAELESNDPDFQAEVAKKEKKAKLKLAREISNLVNVCKSVHFKSFPHSKENHKCNEMVSLGESKAFDLAKNSGQEMVEHNTRFLTRIYPAGRRTNSSNYNPMKMWTVGSQIVALNFQTAGDEMDLNLGKFQQNGNCGFILKPVFLRKANMQFNPDSPGDQYTQKLTLRIISGQQLPKPSREVIDPYVKVTVLDVNAEYEAKTNTVEDNGFNPEWNHTMEFEIKSPELAMLRFVVYDQDRLKDDFIAQYTIPIASIQLGYHHVPLFSQEGDDLDPATLFVHTLMSSP